MVIVIIGTSVCNRNHSLTTGTVGLLSAIDLRVAGSSPVEFFPKVILHHVFFSSYRESGRGF